MYNHERYIAACLESVRTTAYRPLELLVLDDGSTDNSLAVAQSWIAKLEAAQVRATVLTQANQGLTPTLNRLVGLARGEYLALIASDDYLLPDGVGVRVDALRAHPEWLAVFGDGILINEAGERLCRSFLADFCRTRKAALRDPRFIATELIFRWGIPGGSFMARRELYDPARGVGLYDESMPFEDRDLFLRGLARGVIGFVDHPVSAYRHHPTNFFKDRDPERLARNMHGLYRSEWNHLAKYRGVARRGLKTCALLALDEHNLLKGQPHLAPLHRRALQINLGLLRRWHRLKVRLRHPFGD